MINKNLQEVKRAQKEALLLREIAHLFHTITLEEKELLGLTVSKVRLSPDKSVCTVYFYTSEGKKAFDSLVKKLTLYKPSLRAALAHKIRGRYTPNLVFAFDQQFEKQERLEQLLDSIQDASSDK